ncbi:S26 family signal peptidase, partial [Priestia megaterium]|uniref:S26 family signal peptidase n=1 Tax=Priestia megaterium TaxID=1404 RepID=UPI00370951BE
MLNKISHLHPFHIILFHPPHPDQNYIKPVIPLPGHTVQIKNHVLYINPKPYKDPYLKQSKKSLPPNQKFTQHF